MTIDDLYYTCYPTHATQPARMTVDTVRPADEIKPEQTAESAGEMAEKAIEDIKPDAGEQPAETTNTDSTSNNESAAGAESEN